MMEAVEFQISNSTAFCLYRDRISLLFLLFYNFPSSFSMAIILGHRLAFVNLLPGFGKNFEKGFG